MAKIKLNNGNAKEFATSCDLIFTDPPFDMSGGDVNKVLNVIECNHIMLFTTMKQFIELMSVSDWVLSFDIVLDAVVPKKSKNIRQPNYTHTNGFYLVRNNARSVFNRKARQRSDAFDNNGFFSTVIRAPRNKMQEFGMAKNETAMTDILGCFEALKIYDPFAGSGTTGFCCIELDKECEMTEIDNKTFKDLELKFNFFI